jgi:hypothetical protein
MNDRPVNKRQKQTPSRFAEIQKRLVGAAIRLILSEHSQGNYTSDNIQQANQLIYLAKQCNDEGEILALAKAALESTTGKSKLFSKIVASYFYDVQRHSSSDKSINDPTTVHFRPLYTIQPVLGAFQKLFGKYDEIYEEKTQLWQGAPQREGDGSYERRENIFHHCDKKATVLGAINGLKQKVDVTKVKAYQQALQQKFTGSLFVPSLSLKLDSNTLNTQIDRHLNRQPYSRTAIYQDPIRQKLRQLKKALSNADGQMNESQVIGFLLGILDATSAQKSLDISEQLIDAPDPHSQARFESYYNALWHGPNSHKSNSFGQVFSLNDNLASKGETQAWHDALPLREADTFRKDSASPLRFNTVTPQVINYFLAQYTTTHKTSLDLIQMEDTRKTVRAFCALWAEKEAPLQKIKKERAYQLPDTLLKLIDQKEAALYDKKLVESPKCLRRLIQLVALHNQHAPDQDKKTLPLSLIKKAKMDDNTMEQAFKITPPSDWPQLMQFANIQKNPPRGWSHIKRATQDYPYTKKALKTARNQCQHKAKRMQFFAKDTPQQAMHKRWFMALSTVTLDRKSNFFSINKKFNKVKNINGLLATLRHTLKTSGFSRGGSKKFRNEMLKHLASLQTNTELTLPYLQAQLVRILCGNADVSPCGNTMTILAAAMLKTHELTLLPTATAHAHNMPVAEILNIKRQAIPIVVQATAVTKPPQSAHLSEQEVHARSKRTRNTSAKNATFHQYTDEATTTAAIAYVQAQSKNEKTADSTRIIRLINGVNQDATSNPAEVGFAVQFVTENLVNVVQQVQAHPLTKAGSLAMYSSQATATYASPLPSNTTLAQ